MGRETNSRAWEDAATYSPSGRAIASSRRGRGRLGIAISGGLRRPLAWTAPNITSMRPASALSRPMSPTIPTTLPSFRFLCLPLSSCIAPSAESRSRSVASRRHAGKRSGQPRPHSPRRGGVDTFQQPHRQPLLGDSRTVFGPPGQPPLDRCRTRHASARGHQIAIRHHLHRAGLNQGRCGNVSHVPRKLVPPPLRSADPWFGPHPRPGDGTQQSKKRRRIERTGLLGNAASGAAASRLAGNPDSAVTIVGPRRQLVACAT